MPIPEGDPVFSAKVDIVLHDGSTLSSHEVGFRGHPSLPATVAEIEGKFRENAARLISAERSAALVEAVAGLDVSDDVRAVTSLLGPDSTDRAGN
jgi:hypothetical protein